MTTLAILALLIWIYLVFGHGMFWQAGPVLPVNPSHRAIPAGGNASSIRGRLIYHENFLARDLLG